MELIKPFTILTQLSPTVCPHCIKDFAIELYTEQNKPIGYINRIRFCDPDVVMDFIYKYPYSLRYGKCAFCLYEFELDWRYGLPRALPF